MVKGREPSAKLFRNFTACNLPKLQLNTQTGERTTWVDPTLAALNHLDDEIPSLWPTRSRPAAYGSVASARDYGSCLAMSLMFTGVEKL